MRGVLTVGLAAFALTCSASGLLLTREQAAAVSARIGRDADAHVWWTNLTARLETGRIDPSCVPLKGGQWWHYYFCKVCHRLLVTESDTRHVCPKCARAYSGWPYDDAALLLRHMKFADDVRDAGMAYLVSRNARYARYVRDVLLSYVERYPKYELHDNWQKKSHLGGIVTSQALDDATWLIGIASGYDAVAEALTSEERERIERVVLRPEAELLMNADRGSTHVGNHECWHAAAVGLVGYATGDAALVAHAEKSSAGLDYQLKNGVLSDGAWFELAWGYHFYTIQALMPFYRAKRNHGGDVPEALHRMFRAPIAQVMSGWRLPANGDTGAIAFAPGAYGDLYAEAASWWPGDHALAAWAAAAPKGTPGPALWCRGTENAKFPRLDSKCSEGSGIAALRVGQMPDGSPRTSLAFDFGPHGGWHGHHDKLSYELWHEGVPVADDPGCVSYAQPLHFAWFRQTAAHNTLGVDGKSQQSCTGRLIAFHASPTSSVAVASAEIVPGVTATRAVSMEDGLVFDLMWAESQDEHVYDWFFHARGDFSTSVALEPDKRREKVVREQLRPEAWDGSEAYSWLGNPQSGVHAGAWSATWREGARKLSLLQASAVGELHVGLGWGKGGNVRQTVVFNRVKGRSAAFGTVLALDGQVVTDVTVTHDVSGLHLSALVNGVRRVFSTRLDDSRVVHAIRFDRPAEDSLEGWERWSLPIGCGHFGVSVFGSPENERLQVTHNAVATRQNLTNALEIRIRTGHREVTDYSRGIDVDSATAWVRYRCSGVSYARELFASYPEHVMAVRLTASERGRLSFRLSATAPFLRPFGLKPGDPRADGQKAVGFCVFPKKGEWAGNGRRARTETSDGEIAVEQEFEYYSILFSSLVRVRTDGACRKDGEELSVSGATEAVVLFSCDTNHRFGSDYMALRRCEITDDAEEPVGHGAAKRLPHESPMPRVRQFVDNAERKGWDGLRASHAADVRQLLGSASLSLGADEKDAGRTTDALLADYADGRPSAYLEETYWQYGRYLLFSSSRPGTLPANLQGVWNAYERPPWGASYFHDINVQMNYWPAFSTGLAECFQAYADYWKAYRPHAARNARALVAKYVPENLPPDGEDEPDWWCPGVTDYPYALDVFPNAMVGVGIGGLTAKVFADWWEFTRDEAVLRNFAWSAVHGMANLMVRAVRETDGKFLSVHSPSPEQFDPNVPWSFPAGPRYYNMPGSAFDQQLICETTGDLLRMAEHLATNDWVVARAREQAGRYDPVLIGDSGQVKEFRNEHAYGEFGEKHHRHLSQLVGLYPGSQITRNTPDWLDAAKRTLDLRGDESTGWALAHRLNAWARTGDGERSYRLFRTLLGKRTFPNLWDAHPPFQIDGNFGGTSGVTEMLMQSHAGFIDLLPALPEAWKKGGLFAGLRARGAFVVDCEWQDGVPTVVRVRSLRGSVPEVAFAGRPLKLSFESDVYCYRHVSGRNL